MQRPLLMLAIAVAVFSFVGWGSRQPLATSGSNEDYHEECQQEGCDTEEREELHEWYESECFEETCSFEEVRETAGRTGSINAMLNDFQGRGWRISGCHFWGGCFYSPANLPGSGDATFASQCTQSAINQFWSDFDFDRGDWDDGFGYHDACNTNKPLARTFTALNLLDLFGTSKPADSDNWLPWFYAFASNEIDELDARCGFGQPGGCRSARTWWGAQDNKTELYWPFFYGRDVPSRAGIIVHEARHADGRGHDGGGGCPRNASCDTTWGYNGANRYEVLYNWWLRARGNLTTSAIRSLARTRGNAVLAGGFNTRPTRAAVFGAGVSNPTANFSIP